MAWQINNQKDNNENPYGQNEIEQDENYCTEHDERCEDCGCRQEENNEYEFKIEITEYIEAKNIQEAINKLKETMRMKDGIHLEDEQIRITATSLQDIDII